jgi:probable HAF family extracellular repeat protein
VGQYTDANGVFHGFLFSKRVYTTLDNPQAGAGFEQGTTPIGIGPLGQIVGAFTDSNNVSHGFLLSGGQYTTLDDPNAGTGPFQGTASIGINASGQIVGYYIDANSVGHGFLLSGGQYATLDDPNAGTGSSQGTYSEGINASGQIVGRYRDANGLTHGFLLSGGQYTTLDHPNANGYTIAVGINDSGQIVGSYGDVGATLFHGFLLSGGQYTTVDDPKSAQLNPPYSAAFGINNSGQIVGLYRDANFFLHGYAANPVSHGPVAPASESAGSAAMSGRGAAAVQAGAHPVGGALAAVLLGNGLMVSPRAPWSNLETLVSAPLSLSAAPSTSVDPGLARSALPQWQTSSAFKGVAKAAAAGKAVDHVFASFYDPLATVLGDA